MDKKQALITLIKHTYLFTDEVKSQLIARVISMSDEDVYNLGRFLAVEKKKSIEENRKVITSLEALLEELEKSAPTS